MLVIGSGGREHAIASKLSESPAVGRIFASPGSYGIGLVPKVENVDLDVKDFEVRIYCYVCKLLDRFSSFFVQVVAAWCKNNGICLVVVGPEDPLSKGIADVLSSRNINVFGPLKLAARIESDKRWAKEFMDKYRVPTARWRSFQDPEAAKAFVNRYVWIRNSKPRSKFFRSAPFRAWVIKASGLAAGKGVVVASSDQQARDAVDEILTRRKFGSASDTIIVEELLEGEEVSVRIRLFRVVVTYVPRFFRNFFNSFDLIPCRCWLFVTVTPSGSCHRVKITNAYLTVTKDRTRGEWARTALARY